VKEKNTEQLEHRRDAQLGEDMESNGDFKNSLPHYL